MLNVAYCRLCAELKSCSNLLVIKNEDEYSKNLCYQIAQCFQIQISADDNLPKTICLDCCTQTNVTYEFFHKVQRAQEFLRNVVYKPLINNSPPITFIQPVVGLVSNENNIEDLIEARVKSDTSADQDTQHSDSDELWNYEDSGCQSSTDSTSVQSSSTSKIVDKNITEIDKQSQEDKDDNIKIKNEINRDEISGLQTDVANKVQLSEKNEVVTSKRNRNKKKIHENDQEIGEKLKDYIWTCNVCLDKFTTRLNLIDHYRQEHNKPVEYWCAECQRTLCSYTVFVQHVQRHGNDPKFSCEECGKKFYQKRYLTQHLNYFHDRVQLKCDICDKAYKSLLGLKKHKKYHLPNNPDPIIFQCKVCHKIFPSENDLVEHEKIHNELKDYIWTCNVCLDKFTTRLNLIEHCRQEHNKTVEYWCAECRRTLCSYKVFVQHVQRHRNDPKFCCEECGKKFYVKCYLTQHVNYFHGRVQLKCDICGKAYKSLLGLKKHKEYHIPDNSDTFSCKICRKKLLTENDLIEHEKIHDESNKHFTCEQCGSRFRTKVNLKSHIENVHVVYSEDQYVQCPLCPSKFKRRRQLIRHRRIVHFPTKIYTCETCGKKCNRQALYERHRMIHTGERPFKCEHCGKGFRKHESLKIHNRQHTGEKPYCCSECLHYFTDFSNYVKHMRSKHGVTSFKNVKKMAEGKTVS